MTLPIRPPFAPMEALSVDTIPAGPEWQYEPKWDGFHCLVFRDGNEIDRNCQRYPDTRENDMRPFHQPILPCFTPACVR